MAAELGVGRGVQAGGHATRRVGDEQPPIGLLEGDPDERGAVDPARDLGEAGEEALGLGAGPQDEGGAGDKGGAVAQGADGVGLEGPLAALLAMDEAAVRGYHRAVHEQRRLPVAQRGGLLVGVREHQHGQAAAPVGEGEDRPGPVVLLGQLLLEAADDAADADVVAAFLGQVDLGEGAVEGGHRLVEAVEVGQRVAREIEAEELLLVAQALEAGHGRGLAEDGVAAGRVARTGSHEVEEAALTRRALLALGGMAAPHRLHGVDEVLAVLLGEVEGAGADEALEGAGVDVGLAEAADEVVEPAEGAARGARGNDGIGGELADALDGA